mgnify:CR=1 FL=1
MIAVNTLDNWISPMIYVVHNNDLGYPMHLSYKTAKYKDTIYTSYFIAESYREGGKVKKRVLWSIGKLTDSQKEQIQMICKTMSDPQQVLTTFDNISVVESRPFLDLAVANALWDEWEFSKAFRDPVTQGDLTTDLIAKILTINKCVSPCSHYSIPQWAAQTSLSGVVGHPLENLNDDKIYYELDQIDANHRNLEDHLFRITYKKDNQSYDRVNYDLSSSYFVGIKCPISHCGHSKDDKPHNKQVLLAIMVNDKGYPFKWDVYPGNTAEAKTLIRNVDACQKRFGLKNITLVFDRGIVSDENLNAISASGLKYVSALDKDQIASISAIDWDILNGVDWDNFKERLHGWDIYDESLYFKDLGLYEGRRYILGFNPVLCKEERTTRQEKIAAFEAFLIAKNKELAEATRSRDSEKTRQPIFKELRRLKIKKHFADPVLTQISLKRTNKRGKISTISSFEIAVQKKPEQIRAQIERLDGICVFVSNHTDIHDQSGIFPFSGRKIIQAYRDKTKIEDAFKHIKSFLELRPFYVYTPSHVRATYSICVLAYFLNKDLAERRKEISGVDYLNSRNLYAPFRNGDIVTLQDRLSGKTARKPVNLNLQQRELLNMMQLKMPKMIM